MKSDLLKRLQSVNKAADFLGIMFHQENEPLIMLLKEATEALEEMINIFPKKCRFCVGCEEEFDNEDCPAFIFSPRRAKEVVDRCGKWIPCKGSNGKDYRKCSRCFHMQDITGLLNYCPICGARMEE